MSKINITSSAEPRESDALRIQTGAACNEILTAHHHAVKDWLDSPPGERAAKWRAVEAAWRRVKQTGAALQAARNAAAIMHAGGKLRSIA